MSQLDLSLYFNHYLVLLLLLFLLLILISLRFYNFFLIFNIRNNFILNNLESNKNNFKQFSILSNILKL